jgi:UDP-N-acetylglucosamine 2-epimerase (non-hydrolysing)
MTILTVLGTRPEIIKMSPLLPRFDELGRHILVHSGQHYSAEMDEIFFRELELRAPDHFLRVGSADPARQVGLIAAGVEKVILEAKPDWVVVHGDTNTTLGGALAAAKHRAMGVRLAHVEAGARSFDENQAEELNRVLVDRMADLLFAPTGEDAANLAAEGILPERVRVTGNTVAESCLRMAALVGDEPPPGRKPFGYALATLHRQEAVDDPAVLAEVWSALCDIAKLIPLVLPLHPRTRKMLALSGMGMDRTGLELLEPVGYREMTTFLKHARFCLTDSGGLQEEAAILGVPALIVRDRTEHRRYVESGIHRIAGYAREGIVAEAELLLRDSEWNARRAVSLRLDHGVSDRIIDAIRT